MLALTFFGIIHVPINVPALGFSVGEDNVDVDRELKAHGLSNALSGFSGSVQVRFLKQYSVVSALTDLQNYLVYTNSVLFVRSGGDSRVAGVMLAAATFGVLVSGAMIIGYIPIMVVGALIFFLGIDLVREALVEPWGKVHRLEYLTVGLLTDLGILVKCAYMPFLLRLSSLSSLWAPGTSSLASWSEFFWPACPSCFKPPESLPSETVSLAVLLRRQSGDILYKIASCKRPESK